MFFNRRMRWYVSAPLIGVTVLGVSAARWPGELKSCEVAAAWIKANHANLPRSLQQISMYTRPYEIAIVNTLPAAARKELWREHLDAFIIPTANRTPVQRLIVERADANVLTSHQIAMIRGVLGRLDFYFDSTQSLAARRAALLLTVPRVQGAFGLALSKAIFNQLGPVERPLFGAMRRVGTVQEASLAAALSRTAKKTYSFCGCNFDADPCCGPIGWDGCTGTPYGCGELEQFPCNSDPLQCAATPETKPDTSR